MTARTLRPLAAEDIPFAVALTNAEGWGFEAADLRRILGLGGGVLAVEDGERVGLLTLIQYRKLAWIGNVAVLPALRGKGVGAALVDAALTRARTRGAETIGLYSVPLAVTLYERHGFAKTGGAWSLTGEARASDHLPKGVRPLTPERLKEVARFDAPLFGDDRGSALASLVGAFPHTSYVYAPKGPVEGFVIAKPGSHASEVGPLVTRPGERAALAALLDAALAGLPAGPVEAGVREENAAALEAFEARGFRRAFRATTMHHGATGHEGKPEAIAAVGGLEKG